MSTRHYAFQIRGGRTVRHWERPELADGDTPRAARSRTDRRVIHALLQDVRDAANTRYRVLTDVELDALEALANDTY